MTTTPKEIPVTGIVPQTGLIWKGIKPSDFKMGDSSLSPIVLMPDGDWTEYLPTNEAQNVQFKFDTLSCTTFSALNTIETLFNYFLKKESFTLQQRMWLIDNGYFDNAGLINFSDRFTAMMSGTTRDGNDFVSVMNSIRNDGLLPDRDLPFGGNSFEEYHNRSLITPGMIEKAKKMKNLINVFYEWVFIAESSKFKDDMQDALNEALTYAPVQIGIRYMATHAIMAYQNSEDETKVMDNYTPFIKIHPHKKSIHLAFKPFVVIQPESLILDQVINITSTLRKGSKGQEVKTLQTLLGITPVDGAFGPITEKIVIAFQLSVGLRGDGAFGPLSLAKLQSSLKKK